MNLFDLLFAGFIHAHEWHFGIMGEHGCVYSERLTLNEILQGLLFRGGETSMIFDRHKEIKSLLYLSTASYALAYIKGPCH